MSSSPYGQSNPEEPDRPYSGQPYPGQSPYGPQWPDAQPPPGQQPSYGQEPTYGQQPSYDRQPSYGQQPPYGEQSPYGQQPSYGQQSPYGQPDPTSAQPVYGAPYGEPGSPAGAYPAPTPPKKSKALPIVLITLAVILLLCFGGGTFLYVNRDKIQKLADATASGRPTAPTSPAGTPSTEPTSGATGEPTTTYKVIAPKTLNGRPKLTGRQFKSLNDELKKDAAGVRGATSSVGALYGSVDKRNIVAVSAVAAPVDDPESQIEDAFGIAGLHGTKVSGITEVSPGSLGGVARCGRVTQNNRSVAVCSWADDGSFGSVTFFFKSVSSAKAEFPKIRAQIEKKSS